MQVIATIIVAALVTVTVAVARATMKIMTVVRYMLK